MKKNSLQFKIIAHLRTIRMHRKWVRHYCFRAHLYWQGLVHDLSKYSPTELKESILYFNGTRSPLLNARDLKGYSTAWLHHRGRNKHHWDYWLTHMYKGGIPVLMPYNYAVEALCDYLAAARTYMGKNFSYQAECEWWENQKKVTKFHALTEQFLTECFDELARSGDNWFTKENIQKKYKEIVGE